MIVGALLLRDEADRYLRRVLDNVASLCDQIVVVDDGSTDDTARVCREYGATVSTISENTSWWGKDETTPRSHLWTLAAKAAGQDGWIYVADGDHELIDIEPDDFRTLGTAEHVNAWSWPLLDCWDSDELMRTDGYWQAHLHPRPWMVKAVPYPGYVAEWQVRGIHSGHFPANYPYLMSTAPGAIRHLGYICPAARLVKHRKYVTLNKE